MNRPIITLRALKQPWKNCWTEFSSGQPKCFCFFVNEGIWEYSPTVWIEMKLSSDSSTYAYHLLIYLLTVVIMCISPLSFTRPYCAHSCTDPAGTEEQRVTRIIFAPLN